MANEQFRMGPFQELQKHLLDAAIDFYSDLVQQKNDDPTLEATLGRAYWMRGFVHQRMGEKKLALADYEKMQIVFGRLSEDFRDNQEYCHLFAWSFCARGIALRELGRIKEAEEACAKARSLFEGLVAESPTVSEHIVKLGASYIESGRVAWENGQAEDAIAHYTQAIWILEPIASIADSKFAKDRAHYLGTAYGRLTGAFIRTGRWQEAVRVVGDHVKLEPTNAHRWYDYAVSHLGAGDTDGYRAVCAAMLQHFGNAEKPEVAERILYTCVTVPDAVRDSAELLPLAEIAFKLGPGSIRVVGAARYRAGQYEAAARCFEQMDDSARRAWDWFFKAMNHFKLGDAEQARRCLDAGTQWLDNQNRTDPDASQSWGWTEQVESGQLRREAKHLVVSIE